MAIGKKQKIVQHITNGDEFMSAMSDVYSTPFGNVGQHITYKVDKSVLDNAGKARNWEGYEIVHSLRHAASHSRSRMDISDVPTDALFEGYVKPGKWDFEKNKMTTYPDTKAAPVREERGGCGGVILLVLVFAPAVAWALMSLLSSPIDWILTGLWLFYAMALEPIMYFGGHR